MNNSIHQLFFLFLINSPLILNNINVKNYFIKIKRGEFMDITDILKDSVKYPFSDIKTLLIIGVFFVVITLCQSAGVLVDNGAVGLIGAIVAFIISIFVMGYSLDIIKFGIDLEDDMPVLDFAKNFKNGVKLILVSIIYYIIPIIISVILSMIVGGVAFSKLADFQATNSTTPVEVINAMLTPDVVATFAIVFIISVIIFIIFALLALMGQARLAQTGSIDEAISFKQSYRDLKEIGIGKTIACLILLFIILFIIMMIIGFISLIPYVGFIIGALIGSPILMFIQSRAYGLLYSEIAY